MLPMSGAWLAVGLAAWTTGEPRALDEGARALADFQVDDAIAWLEQARGEGPYGYTDHVRLYEQLGIAYAYDGRREEASAAFEKMLAIDPQHALRYTLSPKVTLVFEDARRNAERRGAPAIDVSWPRDRTVVDAIPIDLEVLADPHRFLKAVRVYHRKTGETRFQVAKTVLGGTKAPARITLQPPAPESRAPVDLEVFAVAEDARGNEVLRWATHDRPRTIPLRYEPPPEWYERWWIWTLAAGVLAVGAGAAVYATTRSPSAEIDVTAEAR
jgi:tetratricopeptide (TPR) repeat protein